MVATSSWEATILKWAQSPIRLGLFPSLCPSHTPHMKGKALMQSHMVSCFWFFVFFLSADTQEEKLCKQDHMCEQALRVCWNMWYVWVKLEGTVLLYAVHEGACKSMFVLGKASYTNVYKYTELEPSFFFVSVSHSLWIFLAHSTLVLCMRV